MCVSLEVQGPLPGAQRWLCRFQKVAPGANLKVPGAKAQGMDCGMDVYQPLLER